MRFALRIETVELGSRQIWIDSERTLRIGRTRKAQLAVPDDPHLSGVHFSITRTGDRAFLQDLNSRNGTVVNGQRVDYAELHHGDIIIAGKTKFEVQMVGGLQPLPQSDDSSRTLVDQPLDFERTESLKGEEVVHAASQSPPRQAGSFDSSHSEKKVPQPRLATNLFGEFRRGNGKGGDSKFEPRGDNSDAVGGRQIIRWDRRQAGDGVRYETRSAPSGITYFSPRADVRAPADIAEYIGRHRNLYAVVNHSRLSEEDRLPFYDDAVSAGGAAISRRQLLLEGKDSDMFRQVLERTWGKDMTVCVASRLERTPFLNLVRQLAEQLESPSAFMQRLYTDRSYLAGGVLDGISAVLLEMDQGARWIVFKNDAEIRTWRTLGFPCPPELAG